MNDNADHDPRLHAIPDIHGHAKGEHKAFNDERPIPLSARMLFLWFFHACRRGWPRFLMVTDHMNYLTFEDPAAINLVRRALKLAQAGDLYGAAETASVEVGHAAVVSEGLRRGMRYSIGAEVDNDPRSRPDAQNIVDAMKPDGMIRSVHFLTIDHPTHGPGWSWPFDNPEFTNVYEIVGTAKTWEIYMATLLDAVERLPGNIVGHFYVPALFGHWPDDAVLETYEDQIVAACEARGMAIELNTRFLYRNHSAEEKAKYLTAHRRLLTKCKAKNVGIAVGSDAHSPKDQGRGFDSILALIDECEINELVFPIAGRLARVALRVERKAEAPAAAESLPADDRKTLRKPRTSEVPARSKDSSSKRDDLSAEEETSEADGNNPAQAKPRPKRSRSRAAAAGEIADTQAPDPAPNGTSEGRALPGESDVALGTIDLGAERLGSNGKSDGSVRPELATDVSPLAEAQFHAAAPLAGVVSATGEISGEPEILAATDSDSQNSALKPANAGELARPHETKRLEENRSADVPDGTQQVQLDAASTQSSRARRATTQRAAAIESQNNANSIAREPENVAPVYLEPKHTEQVGPESPGAGQLGRQPDTAEHLSLEPDNAGQINLEPDNAGQANLEPDTAGQISLEPDNAGQINLEPENAGQINLEPDDVGQTTLEADAGQVRVEPEPAGQTDFNAEADRTGAEDSQTTHLAQPVLVGLVSESNVDGSLTDIVIEAEFEAIVTDPAEADETEFDAAEDDDLSVVDETQPISPPVHGSKPAAGKARSKNLAGKAKSPAPAKAKPAVAKAKSGSKKAVKTARNTSPKKAAAKKNTVKKSAVKTAAVKKTSVKKTPAKKAAARPIGVKKVQSKKTAGKKATAKKPAQKRR